MYRILLRSALAIALLSGVPQLWAAEPPAAPSPDAKRPLRAPQVDPAQKAIADRFRAVRIVRDLAEFNILTLKPEETGTWIVAGILPGGASGGLYMQGGYLKAETGEFVDNGVRPSLVLEVGGQWERLELLSGKASPEGRFQWKEPYVDHSFNRNPNIYAGYSVFISPNSFATVICTFHADRKGAEQFSSVTAIPDAWKAFVKPAYEYHVGHSADFAESDLNGLRKLATGENPFIGLTAIRQILRRSTSEEETDQLVDLARSLPTFRQAVLTFWLLKRDDDKARDILLKAVSRSKSSAELTGVALGLESWMASQGRATYFFDPGPGRNLRDKVLERWQSLDPAPVDEEPWKSWQKILAAAGIQEGQSTDDAKPTVKPRNDSKKESKSSGMKERFRFEFWKVGAFQQRPVIQDFVPVNEPFDIRAKNGATATGVLRRTAEGGLHFKGEVSHAGMSAVFDTADERLMGSFFSGKTKGGPDSDGFTWIDVHFSLSHVEEHVPAGLGLGVSGKQDQVIVVPGPKAETQRPSEWFKSRLKAENVVTADQETWVLFRSKQLNPTRMWIEHIERDENTFTVTMNGPEATAGDDHYEVHGVNLGKLPTGTYEVKWIIRSGKGGSPLRDSKPPEPVELKSSFKILET